MEFFGLPNTGNSCFLNSALQILLYTIKNTQSKLTTAVHMSICNGKNCTVCSLVILETVGRELNILLLPDALSDVANLYIGPDRMFPTGTQQDAVHVLRRMICDGGDVFQNIWCKVSNRVVCSQAGCIGLPTERFPILPIPIASASNIQQALNFYFTAKAVEEFNCPKYNRSHPVTITAQVEEAPELLLVQLLRYSETSGKDERKVFSNYFITLNCGEEVCKYKYVGSIMYHGHSTAAGHYTARVIQGDTLFVIDDENIRSENTWCMSEMDSYLVAYLKL